MCGILRDKHMKNDHVKLHMCLNNMRLTWKKCNYYLYVFKGSHRRGSVCCDLTVRLLSFPGNHIIPPNHRHRLIPQRCYLLCTAIPLPLHPTGQSSHILVGKSCGSLLYNTYSSVVTTGWKRSTSSVSPGHPILAVNHLLRVTRKTHTHQPDVT